MQDTKLIGFRVTPEQIAKMDLLLTHLNARHCFNSDYTGRQYYKWRATYQDLLSLLIRNVNIVDEGSQVSHDLTKLMLTF